MIRRYKGSLQTWFGHVLVPGELYDIYETRPIRGYENCEVTVKIFGRSCPYSTRKIFNTIWEPIDAYSMNPVVVPVVDDPRKMIEPGRDVRLL